jgi:hypothetical protein
VAKDQEVDFVFMTGVSSFAKAGIFSGTNNLRIMTLDERWSEILGYTDDEIDRYFAAHIDAWATKEKTNYDLLRQKIRGWYDGYHFGAQAAPVYNPFSLMHALDSQIFENYWFQSGTPTFLMNVLKKDYHTFDPEHLEISRNLLGSFDIGSTPLLTLMFQSGYLTIAGYDSDTSTYTLDYPNIEVKLTWSLIQTSLGLAFKRAPSVFEVTNAFRKL